jgi:hypothetical protein
MDEGDAAGHGLADAEGGMLLAVQRMRPAVGSTTPPSTFISVLLPAPFSPMSPTISPRPTARLTASRAITPG